MKRAHSSFALLVGLVAGCGSSDPVDGQYSGTTLSGNVILSTRSLNTSPLPSVTVPLALTGSGFTIHHDSTGALDIPPSISMNTTGYSGSLTIASFDNGTIANVSPGHLTTPTMPPGGPDARTTIDFRDSDGTIVRSGNALTITLVGDATRVFNGVVGTDFPDGLFEAGTYSLTITAARSGN